MPNGASSGLLLVEDDETFGASLVRGLRSHRFSVSWVRSLREARRALEEATFRLALVDVGLPDGSGMDLCGEIRSRHPGMATVFLTSMSEPSLRLQGLQAGADDYVPKTSHSSCASRTHWRGAGIGRRFPSAFQSAGCRSTSPPRRSGWADASTTLGPVRRRC